MTKLVIKLDMFNRNDITKLDIQAKVPSSKGRSSNGQTQQVETLDQPQANLEAYILLIDPLVLAALPVSRALREPQCNFLVGAFNRITSMNNVPAQKSNLFTNHTSNSEPGS